MRSESNDRNKGAVAHKKCVLCVDVEDWFHAIPTMPGQNIAAWDGMPSRVDANFRTMLEMFSARNLRVSCFFLGWIAERFPELLREAARRGHEICCHGYSHRLAYQMKPGEFLEDVKKAKGIIEDIVGFPVVGYRAPAFSVTNETPWFFDKLAEAGYQFDSSVFPASRRWGGLKNSSWDPSVISTPHGSIAEFPITMTRVLGRPLCVFGGGYLRLFPYPFIKRMARSVLSGGRLVIFYIHPREIDPDQPRLPTNIVGGFKSYVNLHTTRGKIEKIMDDFTFTNFADLTNKN